MPVAIPGFGTLSDNFLFNVSNIAILPAWLVLIFAPKWSKRCWVVYAAVIINGLCYVATFLKGLDEGEGGWLQAYIDMGTLEGVKRLFKSGGEIVLPAWVHYLAHDLLVGNYLVEKNLKDPAGLHHLLMVPVILLVCLAGPVGFLLYCALKIISGLVTGKGSVKFS